jgi:hypothetical protein
LNSLIVKVSHNNARSVKRFDNQTILRNTLFIGNPALFEAGLGHHLIIGSGVHTTVLFIPNVRLKITADFTGCRDHIEDIYPKTANNSIWDKQKNPCLSVRG